MVKAEQTPPDHAAVWRIVRSVAPDATRCRVVYEVPDGDGTAEGVIPIPAGESGDAEGLMPTERKILDVLRASPVPMIRKNVAKALNRKSALGKFATYFQNLVARGHVVRRGQEYTDDPTKFAVVG